MGIYQGFTGYPVTGYYPAGYGYLPDIRIIRIRFFFAGLSGSGSAGSSGNYLYRGAKKLRNNIFLEEEHFFARGACKIISRKKRAKIFRVPLGFFAPPPRAKMFLIQLKSVPNERNICKSFTVILRKYQNFTIILNCNRNNFI